MKLPDLSVVDDSGVREWSGALEPLKSAATQARLKLARVDLGKARDKATLFAELDRAMGLPEHFGHNWDALADVLEDRDWLGKQGRVIALHKVAAFRKDHPKECATLEEILGEASEFWQERGVAFWVFMDGATDGA